jgi:acyl-CoA thioester hydrolase
VARVHIPVALRWADQDAYGHVNNVEIARFLEEARIRTFWRGDLGAEDAPRTAVLDRDDGVMSVVGRLEIEYLMPMPYDRGGVEAQVWIGRLGGASLDVCIELYSPPRSGSQVLFARSTTTLVTVGRSDGRPVRITEEARAVLAEFVEAPTPFSRRPS